MSKVQFLLVLGFAGVMSLAGSFLAVNTLMGGKVNASPSIAVGGAGESVLASKFVLTDKDGNVRGLFICDDEGDVTFSILDKKQNPRITQALTGQEAGLVFTDRRLKKRMSLTTGGRDHPGAFCVYDNNDTPAAVLAVGENNFPLMTLLKGGTICNTLGVNANGQSVISLNHPEGGSCTVVAGKNSPSQIDLVHPGGATIQMFANTNGAAGIELEHKEKIGAQFMIDENGKSKINLCNNKQEIIWTAPK